MFSCFETVRDLVSQIPDLSQLLNESNKYWAHIHDQDNPDQDAEPLGRHIKWVNDYLADISEVHRLDPVIDSLICDLVAANFQPENHKWVGGYVKKLFVAAIGYHDFGKVNDNFQVERLKNVKNFRSIPGHELKYYHSGLSAYLFIVNHFQEVKKFKFSKPSERSHLNRIILWLSYPIFKHHSSCLEAPLGHVFFSDEEISASSVFISRYSYEIEQLFSEQIISYKFLKTKLIDLAYDETAVDFSLFALVKLNFSLLTASDYLATHEYMSGEKTMDFGVFNKRQRVEQIVANLRNTQNHNQRTYSNIEHFEFNEENLREKSTTNLNKLRQEMAVELIQTIRMHSTRYLFYIEAPTGGGKTNLSMIALTELMAANPELNKVYYVFPFTTLITQTYKALQETLLLEGDELVELHSKAGFHSKTINEEERKDGEYGSAKKDYIDNLFALYPVTVLSHVRFFEVLKTNKKEANYLLHRLANSIVIIDELQTYNPKVWDKMLYFISKYSEGFNIRFILMSATLPKISDLIVPGIAKPEFVELLPNARKYITNPNFAERVKFNFELFERKDLQLDELAQFVIDKSCQYADYKCSVHAIIEFIYKKSASEFKNFIDQKGHIFDQVFVLSGTVLEAQRRKIISFLKNEANRNQNILLITTQVVEAGVDIDMDLGFKNISLIDSDEQLAGRVNRNASKSNCEVYLFRVDDPKLLYNNDDRFKVTRDKIPQGEYEDILKEKNFKRLYELVFEHRDRFNNNPGWADNFENSFLHPGVKKLNYEVVNNEFKIIDQQNESVFVPIEIPVYLEDGDLIFSKKDLDFLRGTKVYDEGDSYIDGKKIWNLYTSLISQSIERRKKKAGFDMEGVVYFKALQSIMSKFTFSLFSHSKTVEKIKSLGFGEEKYGFLYISARDSDMERIYTLEGGLNESELNNDGENLFL